MSKPIDRPGAEHGPPQTGGINVSEHQNHSSLYENSEYPSRRQPPRQPRQRRPRRSHGRGGAGRRALKILGTLFLVGL